MWKSQGTIWSFQWDADTLGQEYPLSDQFQADAKYFYFDFRQKDRQHTLLCDAPGMLSVRTYTGDRSVLLIWVMTFMMQDKPTRSVTWSSS